MPLKTVKKEVRRFYFDKERYLIQLKMRHHLCSDCYLNEKGCSMPCCDGYAYCPADSVHGPYNFYNEQRVHSILFSCQIFPWVTVLLYLQISFLESTFNKRFTSELQCAQSETTFNSLLLSEWTLHLKMRPLCKQSGGKSRNTNLRYERACMSSEIF